MEKRILQVRKLSDALRVRLKELKKSDADLLLNLDEEELLDMYKVTQLADYLFTKHEHKKQVRDLVAEFLACLLTMYADVFLTTSNCTVHMNRRFIVVMCVLGIAVAGAFFMGSPMFGGFDGIR